ncbi:hypothetical protein U8C35_07735 [Sinorhizobium medicae]|uniref:hypothetical protein n=1 Tax=Sinorhizobium medicae TaxID=110321 RepID=UPI002AF6B168|nr:hypothetical protein [Sinorhizobium medicae]WQO60302.1 hypothetical protein U8C35_07735 [Sinorhizobium medicae]
MNAEEIAELFIKAAIIDERLPINARPKKLKGSWIPFIHDELDVKSRIKTYLRDEQLHKDDDPFNEWVHRFWDVDERRIEPEDVGLWERANDLITIVSDEGNRRALWAWAAAKAGTLQANEKKAKLASRKMGRAKLKVHKRTSRNVSFAAWCRAEGIHEMTGTRRKDRAIAIIEQQLVRGSSSNNGTGDFGVLPVGPVFEHISDMIGAGSVSEEGLRSIMDDTAFSPVGVLEARDFSWAEARNELRRQREAERRKKAEKQAA